MPILSCKRIVFYCQPDESGFFHALGEIKAIRRMEGRGDTLHLTVPARLSEDSLRGLIGVFHRYQVEMKQLARFETEKNRAWFRNEKMYWFGAVFGTKSKE